LNGCAEMYQNKETTGSKPSEPSSHLSPEENELIFYLIGKRCQTQCTTVAQLFQTEAPLHRRWVKFHTGALCFVKDSAMRSYYIRMYCLIKREMVWEQEIYDEIEFSRVKPFLVTFEGQVLGSYLKMPLFLINFFQYGMVALNFAFLDEAESFLYVSTTTVERRNRRKDGESKFSQIIHFQINQHKMLA
jgi:hypothetical protein